MQRRLIIQAIAGLAGASVTATTLLAQAKTRVEAWKAPGCGCCEDWVHHMEANGFQVTMHESGNTAARTRLHIPEKLGSCHTAQVGGYALEGHVPAREIRRLLKERPTAVGLTVPGMVIGSPGMDGPAYGGRKDPYDVLLISADGSTRVYQSYNRT
ncbi:MAG: metal-binding protein [Burkholderiales bacterium RIFCSPHIGHO2_12_FULL_61_11]|nr:MAG: metal-binding protein [Burkholderiales bacterium RIFCSPHIGHO2_12_FULL_61_11]